MNDLAIALRKRARNSRALSAECQTRAMLIAFLKSHTTLEVKDRARGCMPAIERGTACRRYAARRYGRGKRAERRGRFMAADTTATAPIWRRLRWRARGEPLERTCSFCSSLRRKRERVHANAWRCLKESALTAVYGMHNLPGFAKGTVMVRGGTFACASKGLTLRFTGRQCHAAYPETGLNPAYAMAALVTELKALTGPAQGELVLCTLVHMRVGERAFGVSAGDGELALTLRAERLEALDALQERIVNHARELCREQGLGLETAEDDVFPDTRCREADVKRFCASAAAAGLRVERLEKPMRWSEDFGWYLRNRPGVFFGIGAGEEHAALHTPEYEYDDALIGTAVQAFLAAIESAEFASREHVK